MLEQLTIALLAVAVVALIAVIHIMTWSLRQRVCFRRRRLGTPGFAVTDQFKRAAPFQLAKGAADRGEGDRDTLVLQCFGMSAGRRAFGAAKFRISSILSALVPW
jgi:hypothetical protein